MHPYEAEISTFLSTKALASDLHNHCNPIHEVLKVPDNNDRIILVMPLLRPYNNPPFKIFGEAVDFFGQIFEVSMHFAGLGANHLTSLCCASRPCSSCTSIMSHIGE
jgi:hypothetical protein